MSPQIRHFRGNFAGNKYCKMVQIFWIRSALTDGAIPDVNGLLLRHCAFSHRYRLAFPVYREWRASANV